MCHTELHTETVFLIRDLITQNSPQLCHIPDRKERGELLSASAELARVQLLGSGQEVGEGAARGRQGGTCIKYSKSYHHLHQVKQAGLFNWRNLSVGGFGTCFTTRRV